MSVTWDDTISDGEEALHPWANSIIAAIKRRGSKYVVTDDAYGDYQCDGTDDDVQIQAALDALTGGRTNKEKVTLRGNFTVSSAIVIPSYTIVDFSEAIINLADMANVNVFESRDVTDIDVLVGVIEGNGANQTTSVDKSGIFFGKTASNSERINVIGGHIKNCIMCGVIFDYVKKGRILYPTTENNGESYTGASYPRGVYVDCGEEVTVFSPLSRNEGTGVKMANGNRYELISPVVYGDSTKTTYDSILIQGVDRMQVSNPIIENAGQDGINLSYGAGSVACTKIDILSPQVKSCRNGINVMDSPVDITIKGGVLENNDRCGVRLAGATKSKIIGVTAKNNAQNVGGTSDDSGIRISDSSDNIIALCSSYDDQGVKTQLYGIREDGTSNLNIIKGNYCTGNSSGPYITVGARNTYDGKVQSPTPADLSGAAVTHYLLHAEEPLHLTRAILLYTEASSADAGITVEIGKESDRNYYYTGTTEVNKAQWYTLSAPLLKNDVAYGDTVTFYSPGGKVGTGEIVCIISYAVGA